MENTENEKRTCIYLMRDVGTGFVKIGRSDRPEYREKTLMSQSASVYLICYWKDCLMDGESKLHKFFAVKRMRGEWFDLTDDMIAYMYWMTLNRQRVDVHAESMRLYRLMLENSFSHYCQRAFAARTDTHWQGRLIRSSFFPQKE
jgi:hypothetical protein